MSMFKRMLASVGIGAAQVDLMLHEDVVHAGDTVNGVVRIEGGRVDQEVDDVYAYVMTRYMKEHNDSKVEHDAIIAKFPLAGKFTVQAEQVYEFPVSFKLPPYTPVSMGHAPVWIRTGLEIKEAVDPKDRDYLEVLPHPHVEAVLDAVKQLGFRLRAVTCEHAPHFGRMTGMPFVQEFEFVPTTQFRGQLDEVEIIFSPTESGVEMLLQIDRKARGISGLFADGFDTDESFVRMRLDRSQLANGTDYIADQLAETIRNYAH